MNLISFRRELQMNPYVFFCIILDMMIVQALIFNHKLENLQEYFYPIFFCCQARIIVVIPQNIED